MIFLRNTYPRDGSHKTVLESIGDRIENEINNREFNKYFNDKLNKDPIMFLCKEIFGINKFTSTIPKEARDFEKMVVNRKKSQKHYNLGFSARAAGIFLAESSETKEASLINTIAKKYNCPMVTCSGEDFASKYVDDGIGLVGAVFSKLRRMAKNPVNKNKKAVFLCINNAEVLLKSDKIGVDAAKKRLFYEMNRIKEGNKNSNPKIIVFMETPTEKGKK